MLRDREAVGLVAKVLQEVESLRRAGKDEREVVAGDPHLFEALRQAYDGHVRTHRVQGGAGGVHLGKAAVHDDQVGPVGETLGASRHRVDRAGSVGDAVLVLSIDTGFLGEQPREAARETLVHRARVVGSAVSVLAADVVGAVGVLARHTVFEDHHRGDLVLPTRVRDVVALDAQGRARQIEVLGQLLECLRARSNIARALRAVQGEGLAGVLRDRLHDLCLRPALGHVHRHGRTADLGQPACDGLHLRRLDGNKHLTRDRRGRRVRNIVHAHRRHLCSIPGPGLVRRRRRIHLLEEASHERRVVCAVHPLDHPAARAPDAPAAHVDNVHRSVQVVADEREHVSIRAIVEHDRVALQHRAQRLDIVAQLRRTLEVELHGGLTHLLLQVTDHRACAPLHELTQALRELAVLLHGNAPHTRGRALVDVTEQARAPLRLRALKHTSRTRAHREDAKQLIDRLANRPHLRVRAEVARPRPLALARHLHAREALPHRHRQVGVGLVVLKHDVEARIEFLNPRELQGESLDLGPHDGPLHGARGRHHLLGARVQVRQVLEVVGEAIAQVFGLADVDDAALRV